MQDELELLSRFLYVFCVLMNMIVFVKVVFTTGHDVGNRRQFFQ